jgi:hypothetical protein
LNETMPVGTFRTMRLNDQPSWSARAKRHLLIISRHHPGLYDYVTKRFAGEPSVEVILDRRRGRDRRAQQHQAEVERRAADRRTRPDIDAALRMESMQFLTIPLASAGPTEGCA